MKNTRNCGVRTGRLARVAAMVRVNHPNEMTPEGVKDIAKFLRGAARDLTRLHSRMGAQMTWRYWYT